MRWFRAGTKRSSDCGTTSVEYGIIIAGVAVVAIPGILFLQNSAKSSYSATTDAEVGVCVGSCPASAEVPQTGPSLKNTVPSGAPIATAPSMTTLAATGIVVSGATLHGTVNANAASTTVSFCYGTDSALSTCTSVSASPSPVSGSTVTNVSAVVTGLPTSTQYYFRIDGTNSVGSASGSILPFTTLSSATVPDSPTGLGATDGLRKVDLSWTAPPNGGSPITDYLIEFKLSSASTWSTFTHAPSAATTVSVTGLTDGNAYQFRVSAVNGVGTGNPSATAPANTYGVPDAPSGVAVTAAGVVSWNAATANGSTVTGYTATAWTSTSNGSAAGTCSWASGGLNCTLSGNFAAGSAYYVDVKATNAVGTSSASSPRVTWTAVAPTAPTGLSAATGSGANGGKKVKLYWTAAGAGVGAPVTGYEIEYRGTSPVGTWTLLTTTTSAPANSDQFEVTMPATNTLYDFRVRAVNSLSIAGAYSNTDSATSK